MLKLSVMARDLKQYALNPGISDEKWLNEFLRPYVSAGKIRNKRGEEYHLDKARTSRFMNGKEEVPEKFRDTLSRIGIKEKMVVGMVEFLDDYVNLSSLPQLKEYCLKIIRADSMLPEMDKSSTTPSKTAVAAMLSELLIRSLSVNNVEDSKPKFLWKNGSNAVETIAGDLFHFGFDNRKKTRKNIVVIPVNTAFDTHVTRKLEGETNPVVSDMTIHGQWLSRMEQSGENPADLDKRIADSLACLGYTAARLEKSVSGKCEVYGIGSVAVIETNNAVYFLLAISEFDEANHVQSTPEDIRTAVNSLLQIYDRIGQGYDLYMPVMGTGRSRTGMLFGEAYRLLASVLIDNRIRIQGHVYIVVKPENMSEIEEGEHDISH